MIQLINRALQSDKEAFLELMNQNSCSMYKIAWAVLKNTDDAANLSLAEFEFKELLQGLDEKYRIILILYYAEELRISEIASP